MADDEFIEKGVARAALSRGLDGLGIALRPNARLETSLLGSVATSPSVVPTGEWSGSALFDPDHDPSGSRFGPRLEVVSGLPPGSSALLPASPHGSLGSTDWMSRRVGGEQQGAVWLPAVDGSRRPIGGAAGRGWGEGLEPDRLGGVVEAFWPEPPGGQVGVVDAMQVSRTAASSGRFAEGLSASGEQEHHRSAGFGSAPVGHPRTPR